jgi:Fur family ferric uptake transcriptional regulator
MAMPCLETVEKRLRQEGCRITGARQAVIRVLLEASEILRPAQILQRAQYDCPSLGLVTVYRTLSLLSGLGLVQRAHPDDSYPGYAWGKIAQSHHIICRGCKQIMEIPLGGFLLPLIKRAERETGFAVETQCIELHGLCPDCQRAAQETAE